MKKTPTESFIDDGESDHPVERAIPRWLSIASTGLIVSSVVLVGVGSFIYTSYDYRLQTLGYLGIYLVGWLIPVVVFAMQAKKQVSIAAKIALGCVAILWLLGPILFFMFIVYRI